jgi:pimeloyl-ACP methyl ester carboxylesterase
MIPCTHFPGTGPKLHLAHANAYPPEAYRGLVSALTPAFDVWAVHHRPLWPGSRPEAIDSWQPIAADMVRFFEEQGLTDLVAVGHSLGAVATLMAAVMRPELFRVLVLVEPVFFVPDFLAALKANRETLRPRDFPHIRAALRRRNHWSSREEAFTRWRAKAVFATLSDAALMDYVSAGTEPDAAGGFKLRYPREWEARIYSLPPTNVWELLPQVRRPTLAIRGANSATLVPGAWALWQETQPEATFLEIPDADHLAPLSHSEVIAEAIRTFER